MVEEGDRIERQSFSIIEDRISVPYPERDVVTRVIHSSADFDFADLLVFKNDPVKKCVDAIKQGKDVITDVNMVRAGINSRVIERYGGTVKCFIKDGGVRRLAESEGLTRARSAFRLNADELNGSITVIGNAPTALFELCDLITSRGIRPEAVIAVPVGFVGAAESKEQVLGLDVSVSMIVSRGVKGGSTVAAAIVNALVKLAEKDGSGKH
jgi:precorrin-8X/cobalt-precorrin-8 methylmutase